MVGQVGREGNRGLNQQICETRRVWGELVRKCENNEGSGGDKEFNPSAGKQVDEWGG